MVLRQSNAVPLLQIRRRISARAACALAGSVSNIPICGKLWMRNADDVSVPIRATIVRRSLFLVSWRQLFSGWLLSTTPTSHPST
jgi:hypothetical protein